MYVWLRQDRLKSQVPLQLKGVQFFPPNSQWPTRTPSFKPFQLSTHCYPAHKSGAPQLTSWQVTLTPCPPHLRSTTLVPVVPVPPMTIFTLSPHVNPPPPLPLPVSVRRRASFQPAKTFDGVPFWPLVFLIMTCRPERAKPSPTSFRMKRKMRSHSRIMTANPAILSLRPLLHLPVPTRIFPSPPRLPHPRLRDSGARGPPMLQTHRL